MLFSSYGLTAIASLPALSTASSNASNNTPLIRDSAGNLYGIDPNGGPSGAGTIFKVDGTTHAITPLVSFDGTQGVNPTQIAIDSQGNIFGVTHFDNFANGQVGATEGSGVLFELPANNQTSLQIIYTFTDNSIGQFPQALVLDSSDNIYCLTSYGGTNNAGSIVKFTANTFSVSTVASLPGAYQNIPNSLTLANGVFYGTTFDGGSSNLGTFFELPAGATTFNVASFTGTANGSSPNGAPLVDANGNIYGTTEGGGANGLGAIYQYSANSNTLTAIASVPDSLGRTLVGNLVEDTTGNLYGTIETSGSYGGTYELDGQTDTFTSLAQFDLSNGADPMSGLVADGNGNFYGITFTGGANSAGAFYELSPGTGGGGGGTGLTPTITRSTVPTAVVGGTAVRGTVTIDVMNPGSNTDSGTVAVYASTDGSIDGSSILLGSYKPQVDLKTGKSQTIAVSVNSSSVPAGTYTILAQATDTSSNVVASTTGPTLTVAAPFLSFSETVTTVNLASSVVSGTVSHAMAKVVIKNSGNVNSKRPVAIAISASTTPNVAGTLINSVSPGPVIRANGGTAIEFVPFKELPNLANNDYYITASVTDPMGGSSVASTVGTTTIAAPFITLALAFGNIPRAVLTAGAPLIIINNGNIDDTSTFTAVIGLATNMDGTGVAATGAGTLAPAKVTVRAGKTATVHVTGWDPLLKSIVSPTSYFLTVTITDANGNSTSVVSTGEI